MKDRLGVGVCTFCLQPSEGRPRTKRGSAVLAMRILVVQVEGGLVQMLAVLFSRGARVLGACVRPRAPRARGALDLFFSGFRF